MRFREEANVCSHWWKSSTQYLPEAARGPGPVAGRGSHDFCLPAPFARYNLLPDAGQALEWFASAAIPWHASVGGGPTNHLLSSQVQCVNALAPVAHDAEGVRPLFGDVLDVAEVLPLGILDEPDRVVDFEFVGDDDPLNEWSGPTATRGALNTSADAVFRYRTSDGSEELCLVEWKYVEDYSSSRYDDQRFAKRYGRYEVLLDDPDGPVRPDVQHGDLFCEPIYQLMRLQLLAHVLETRGAADRVRLLVWAPFRNDRYWQSVPDRLAASRPGFDNIADLWRSCLTRPDRFVVFDTACLLRRWAPTSHEFRARYAHLGVPSQRDYDVTADRGPGPGGASTSSPGAATASSADGLTAVDPLEDPRIQLRSWQVAARLLERNPSLMLIENHPGGGQYDCLAFYDRHDPHSGFHIDLNRVGSAHVWRRSTDGPDSWPTFWAECLDGDIDEAVFELERRAELRPDAAAVLARPDAQIAQLIAATLEASMSDEHTWEWRNGFCDTSGMGGGPQDGWFERIPAADLRRQRREPDLLAGVSEYRFWFLLRDGEPFACVDVTGWGTNHVADEEAEDG